MKFTADVSVVIPTRNRLNSLNRTLQSISNQFITVKEIFIVDSSDAPLTIDQVKNYCNHEIVQIIHSKPSVCLQRNIGIEKCSAAYIFLCDDDIAISTDYIKNLLEYLSQNKNATIVSGLIYEKKEGIWQYSEKKKSFLKLFYAHIFGLSVWSEITNEDYSKNKLIQNFVSYYIKKGNRIAKSGWPIVINYNEPSFKTPIYGLGASIIKSNLLKKCMFDSAFFENGIGDNYDVAMNINEEVYVLNSSIAYHYKEKGNRINGIKTYFYRIMALHYIVKKHKKFTTVTLLFLIWSLIGNSIVFLVNGNIRMLSATTILLFRIIFNKNIYLKKN